MSNIPTGSAREIESYHIEARRRREDEARAEVERLRLSDELAAMRREFAWAQQRLLAQVGEQQQQLQQLAELQAQASNRFGAGAAAALANAHHLAHAPPQQPRAPPIPPPLPPGLAARQAEVAGVGAARHHLARLAQQQALMDGQGEGEGGTSACGPNVRGRRQPLDSSAHSHSGAASPQRRVEGVLSPDWPRRELAPSLSSDNQMPPSVPPDWLDELDVARYAPGGNLSSGLGSGSGVAATADVARTSATTPPRVLGGNVPNNFNVAREGALAEMTSPRRAREQLAGGAAVLFLSGGAPGHNPNLVGPGRGADRGYTPLVSDLGQGGQQAHHHAMHAQNVRGGAGGLMPRGKPRRRSSSVVIIYNG
ncbi:hypothetical protein T492DRAFT_246471 [Pavlovales sp. CCMP2436]|nr:hypothetical protein T492DRAFT_246471 [Pavlovales sp. CCMP2436]